MPDSAGRRPPKQSAGAREGHLACSIGATPQLACRASVSLAAGQVESFTDRPTYVHRVTARTDALSLHLYGDEVASYHAYDPTTGDRTRVVSPPTDSPVQV